MWLVAGALGMALVTTPADATPTNCDFEWGTLTGWTVVNNNCGGQSGGYVQVNSAYAGGNCSPGSVNWAPECSGLLPRVSPGGGCYAAEIYSGNGCTCGQILLWYELQTSFIAPSAGSLCWQWAALLTDGHPCGSGARVNLTVSANGVPLTSPACAVVQAEATASCQTGVSGDPTPACTTTACGSGNILWSYYPWQTCCADLSGYAGQTITIAVRATSCTQTAHSAYAFLDNVCVIPCNPLTASCTPSVTRTPTFTPAPATLTYLATLSLSATPTPTRSATASRTATPTRTGTICETATPTRTATPWGRAEIRPNPVQNGTILYFRDDRIRGGFVTVTVYNVGGEEVARPLDRVAVSPGIALEFTWDVRLAGGVYFLCVRATLGEFACYRIAVVSR